LTLAQACRLWQIDLTTCEAVMQILVGERFLHRTIDGAFIAFPTTAKPIKASLFPMRLRRLA
jgi:hypothetical protein